MKQVFTILLLLVSAAPIGGALPHRPVQPQRVSTEPVVHPAPLPPTLHGVAKAVDLVLLGRVTKSSGPKLEKLPDGREFVRRYQEVEPVEILKGGQSITSGTHVLIRQPGGTVDVGGREVSSQYLQPPLEPGDLVLLFLQGAERSPGVYLIAFGPSGAVWVDAARYARIPTPMRNLAEISGRAMVPLDELMAILRTKP